MLIAAIVLITGALILYSIGVWGEKVSGALSPRWLLCFWLGLACDTAGTIVMNIIAGGGPFKLNFHGITGLLAILLMIAHALWATVVLVKKREESMKSFHRFSLAVWCVWLLPYLSGLVFGIME